MKRLPVMLVLAGCDLSGGERATTGECPELTCSDATPAGLHFYGEPISQHDWLDDLFIDGPATTATGGIQRVQIAGLDGAPFEALTDSTAGISVDSVTGETVTLRGTGDGSDYLRIAEPGSGALYDRKRLYGARILDITLEPIEWEVGLEGTPWAFKGIDTIAVALWGSEVYEGKTYRVRLVDSSMTLTLPAELTQAAWDAVTVPSGTGDHDVIVKAGDHAPVTLTANIVDAIDDITTTEPLAELPAGQLARVCFVGLAAGRPVAGLAWQFVVGGKPTDAFPARNCVFVSSAQEGMLDITAAAEGRQQTLHVAITAAGARIANPALPRSSTAGDRAASYGAIAR